MRLLGKLQRWACQKSWICFNTQTAATQSFKCISNIGMSSKCKAKLRKLSITALFSVSPSIFDRQFIDEWRMPSPCLASVIQTALAERLRFVHHGSWLQFET